MYLIVPHKRRPAAGHRTRFKWISFVCVVILQAAHWMEVFSDDRESSGLQGDFSIGKEGRLILLPVEVGDRKYSFMLDTGAHRSAFDQSMRSLLGKPGSYLSLQTFAGMKRVQTFNWPDATLGGQPLGTKVPVACVDFSELRHGSSEKIFGVLGMDVLGACRFQIDFDRGTIRFLATLPTPPHELGVKIPLDISADGNPFVLGAMTDDLSEKFLIDTGSQGNSICANLFDELLGMDSIRLGGSFTSRTVAGEVSGNRGRLRFLSIGPFEHEGLRMSRLNISSLGLRYLSRFVVTFDFPAKAIYLRKGEGFLKPEPRATSGMTLTWNEGNIKVGSIKKDGPAAKAGILADDVFVTIDGKGASDYDHFSLRQLLTSEGGKGISTRVLRANEEINLRLVLDDD